LLFIAPLSANTMAKLANGLCDNLLTSVFRCWDFKNKKPVLVAPAMNTLMYEHPITEIQEKFLRDTLGVVIIPTV
jgi:phosphopantothenoylcysteine decarboxylase